MPAFKTRIELVSKAASKLQVLEAGQTLEAEDEVVLDGMVDSLFAQLAADGICVVGDETQIPAEWFDPLASLLANMNASDFGKPYSEEVKTVFEFQLRRMNASRPTYEPQPAEYY